MAGPDTVGNMPRKTGKPTLPPDQAKRVQQAAADVLRRLFSGNQTRMGHAFGISQASISRWARGAAVPSQEHLDQIAKMLNLRVEEIRFGVHQVKNDSAVALEVALQYADPKEFPEHAIRRARALCERGMQLSAKGWTSKLSELASEPGR